MLTIIVKGTNGCNLACSYCSLGEKSNFKFINKDNLKSIMIYSCDLVRYRNEKKVNFILHGGEPTLVNPGIYDECVSYIKDKYSDLEVKISMQTNGFSITDQFMNLIKKHDIHVGVSIDGSKEIHDSERKSINGTDTFDKVTSTIEKLLDANVPVSCLMVLTKNALKKDLKYLHYFEEKKIHLKINPLLNYGETLGHPELVLDKNDYANYIIKVYETIVQENMDVYISPIDKLLTGIIHDQPIKECSFDSQCNKRFLCIDYKGDIYPCGKFSDIDKMCIGNVDSTSFDQVEDYLLKKICIRRSENIPQKCKDCKYVRLCNAGCSAEAMIEGEYFNTPILCEDYYMLFNYFHTDGLKLLKETLVKNKRFLEEQI